MSDNIKKNKMMANPILVGLEVLFVDWWMKPIFALLYSVTAVTMRNRLSSKVSFALKSVGVDLDSDTNEYFNTRKYSILKDIEIQFATKSPIRFIMLGLAIYLVGINSPDFVSKLDVLNSAVICDLGLLIIVSSVLAYFYGRWQIYKIARSLL